LDNISYVFFRNGDTVEAVEAAEESAISYRMTLGEESTALEARAAGPGQDRTGQDRVIIKNLTYLGGDRLLFCKL
jgi:hypothetical protein